MLSCNVWLFFFFSSRRRHTRFDCDWSSDVCSSDLGLLRLFERKFPQLLFSVLVANLGSRVLISEYAFWLINRARFSTLNAVGPKNFDLLLVVDPDLETAALIVGYGLEEYLSEHDL